MATGLQQVGNYHVYIIRRKCAESPTVTKQYDKYVGITLYNGRVVFRRTFRQRPVEGTLRITPIMYNIIIDEWYERRNRSRHTPYAANIGVVDYCKYPELDYPWAIISIF